MTRLANTFSVYSFVTRIALSYWLLLSKWGRAQYKSVGKQKCQC